MKWFSACLRVMCLIEDAGGVKYQDDIVVITATDWEEARRKAIAHGRSRETRYTNIRGKPVRWAFERVVTLVELGGIFDGSEIYSQSVSLDGAPVPFNAEFDPEASEPT